MGRPLPEVFVVAVAVPPLKVATTTSPAVPVPYTVIGLPRCTTMWLAK